MRRSSALINILFLVLLLLFCGMPEASANTYFTAYYGTTNTTNFNTAAANWVGGSVYWRSNGNNFSLGDSSNTVRSSGSGGDRTFRVIPDNGYRIVSISWCDATWWPDAQANHINPGTWNSVSGLATNQTDRFDFTISTTNNHSYLLWVVFGPELTPGGKVGAWYGTNNVTGYDTPTANGSGGTVWQTSGNDIQLGNRDPNGYHRTSDDNRTFEVRPANGFRIVSIQYGVTLNPTSWTPVTVSANQTTNVQFSITIQDGNQYVIWVQFASTAASSFTVTGTVDPASDPACTSNSITPASRVININQTGDFVLGTSSNCSIDCVTFPTGGACATWTGTGSVYTTPAITANTTFTVRFKPIGFTIDAYVDSTSPTGSGSIAPAGTVATGNAINVPQGGSQTFTITANPGYSVAHVWVTDPGRSYANQDLAPISINPYTYTFNNVQANGTIHVQFVQLVPTAGRDYCQIPPFVQGRTDLVPNVMIVFDNSGSMGGSDTDGYAYYNTHSYSCTASHNTTTNKCTTIFEGYFDPYQMYKLDTNANVYLKDNVTLNLAANGLSGNYLNYRFMHKVDVIRKLLVGGRVTGKASTTLASSNGTRATIATKFLWADIGKWVEFGTSEPTGILQTYASRVRFGLEVFGSSSNSNSDGGTIVARLGAPMADLINKIEGPDTNPRTNTPIAEALYEAIRYFQAKPSAYNNGTDYGDSTEPDGWNAASNPIIQFACQRNFVLLLTDGEANSTDKLPGLSNPSLNGYTDTVFNVNTWVNRIATADKPTSSDGRYSDGVAYMGHVTDLRSSAFGNDMAGNQTITFYTVYAFGNGTGQQTLKTLSKYGGFNNRNGNDAGTDPNKYPSPDLTEEWDNLNGVADGIPDTYFEGNDGAVIGQNIISALQAMTASVSSGTAASILANSEGSGANLLQAIFYPVKDFENSTSVAWIGELHNLWYFIDPRIGNSSLREDTNGDQVFNLKSDRVVNYVFNGEQTLVNLMEDTNGDGAGDLTVGTAVNPDNVNSIWRAGRLLWARTAASRTIYTPCSIKDASSACLACIGGTCPSGSSNSGMMEFSDTNNTLLGPYLQSADASTTTKIINWVRGEDQGTSYRQRSVSRTVGGSLVTNVWKLGDIISSTPRLLSNMPIQTHDKPSPLGYADISYGNELGEKSGFIYTNTYKDRGMVFAGANDGMFHAFKLGKLDVTTNGDQRAKLLGTELGKEAWAFIPKSTLPYLKYMGDPAYGENFHLMYVDGPTTIVDASIGIPSTCSETTAYWNCAKDTATGNNWRTVVIGSMGTGGASKNKADTTCTNCVKTPIMDPADDTKGFGYSSYFALDVTDPEKPTLLWEFSSPDLGFATSGPAVLRLKAPTDGPESPKNGRWVAVLASGPTGPLTDKQFHGRSSQPLKVFVLDLKTGELLGTISSVADGASSSALNNAFAGSIFTSYADTDRYDKASAGFYQDDVLYIGYTQANSNTIDSTTTWTTGGLLRLVTGEKLNSDGSLDLTNGWKLSKVIDNIGPVTTNIGKLYNRKNHELWLYFGTGRYFDTNDDQTTRQHLFGIKEPCYKAVVTHADSSVTKDDIDDNNCTTKLSMILDLDDQSNSPSATLSAITNKGWYIDLDDRTTDFDAERVLTDPVLSFNGVVYFVTFKPTSDPCSFGGQTNMWGVSYFNGAAPPAVKKGDKALLQLSTGSFEGLDLKDQMTARDGRRTTNALIGKPPSDAPPIISGSRNKPIKKILQIREK